MCFLGGIFVTMENYEVSRKRKHFTKSPAIRTSGLLAERLSLSFILKNDSLFIRPFWDRFLVRRLYFFYQLLSYTLVSFILVIFSSWP